MAVGLRGGRAAAAGFRSTVVRCVGLPCDGTDGHLLPRALRGESPRGLSGRRSRRRALFLVASAAVASLLIQPGGLAAGAWAALSASPSTVGEAAEVTADVFSVHRRAAVVATGLLAGAGRPFAVARAETDENADTRAETDENAAPKTQGLRVEKTDFIFADRRRIDEDLSNRTMSEEEYVTAIKQLTPYQRYIAIEAAVEKPNFDQKFTNGYSWNTTERGVYASAVSGAILFSSDAKFDSGFGWPSFTDAIDDSRIYTRFSKQDQTVKPREKWRVQVLDRASMTHLGYVYTGGPSKSGRRYILNAAVLKFLPGDPADFGVKGGK